MTNYTEAKISNDSTKMGIFRNTKLGFYITSKYNLTYLEAQMACLLLKLEENVIKVFQTVTRYGSPFVFKTRPMYVSCQKVPSIRI